MDSPEPNDAYMEDDEEDDEDDSDNDDENEETEGKTKRDDTHQEL